MDVSEAEIRPPAPDVDPVAGSSPQYLDPAARLRRTESAGNLLPDGRYPLQVPRQRPPDHEKPVKLSDYQVSGPKSTPKPVLPGGHSQPVAPQPAAPQPVPGRRGSAPRLARTDAPAGPPAKPDAPTVAGEAAPVLKSGKYRSGPPAQPASPAEPIAPLAESLVESAEKLRPTKPQREGTRVAASRWLVPVGLVVGFTLTLAGVLYYLLVIAKR